MLLMGCALRWRVSSLPRPEHKRFRFILDKALHYAPKLDNVSFTNLVVEICDVAFRVHQSAVTKELICERDKRVSPLRRRCRVCPLDRNNCQILACILANIENPCLE